MAFAALLCLRTWIGQGKGKPRKARGIVLNLRTNDASQPKVGQGATVLDGRDGGGDKVCLSMGEHFVEPCLLGLSFYWGKLTLIVKAQVSPNLNSTVQK